MYKTHKFQIDLQYMKLNHGCPCFSEAVSEHQANYIFSLCLTSGQSQPEKLMDCSQRNMLLARMESIKSPILDLL